jgi:hypothetical protein
MKFATLLPTALFVMSCGGGSGSAPPAESPPPSPSEPTAVDIADTPITTASASAPPVQAPPEPAAATSPPASTPKIEFPPHASVEEAIKAIPQGVPRLNMSNDLLQAPLLDLTRYDKCKVPRSTKVSLNVAVYDGVAVGVTVTTKPKSAKIEDCLDTVVRGMTWDKVPSLNQATVTF